MSQSVKLGNEVLATAKESELVKVEGNWYFPMSAIKERDRFVDSNTHTHCPWKGDASYYSYKKDDGSVLKDVAWFYPTPKQAAANIKDRIAFYVGRQGIKLEGSA